MRQAIEIDSTPISPQRSSHLAFTKGRATKTAPTEDGFAGFLDSLLGADKQSNPGKTGSSGKEGLWELAGAGIILPLPAPDPLLTIEEQVAIGMVEQVEAGMVEQVETGMAEQTGIDAADEALEASFRERAVDSVWEKLMDVTEEEAGIDREQENVAGEGTVSSAEVRIDLETGAFEGVSRDNKSPKLMGSPERIRTEEEDLQGISEREKFEELDPTRVEEELGRIRGDKGEFMTEGRIKDGAESLQNRKGVKAEARSSWKEIFTEEQAIRKNQNSVLYRAGSGFSSQEESFFETGEGAAKPFADTIEEKVTVDTTTHPNISFDSAIAHPVGEAAEALPEAKTGETFGAERAIRQDEVLRQIVTGARLMVKDGTARVHMQLEPKELGKVQLALVIERDLVTARFVTESKAVQSLIEANLSDLRSSLQEAGLQADLLQVSVQTGGFNHREQAFPTFEQLSSKGLYQEEEELLLEEVSSVGRRGSHRPGGVDIWV